MRPREAEKPRILVVDDDAVACQLLEEVLAEQGYRVEIVQSGPEALRKSETGIYDLVITDLKMPGLDGLEVLKAFKQVSPETLVIMNTAFGSMESAIEAIKAGAFDYLSKPFREDEIKIVVRRALLQKHLQKQNELFRRDLTRAYGLDQIIGRSRLMLDVYKTVALVLNSKSTVLIQGESGTGKELIARAIHYNGLRSEKPFVVVNCAALPEHLLESELFGHVKGAFTGAVLNKKGLFEEAHEGTCFLDEIGDLSQPLQAKLLRVIQEREIRRLGSNDPIQVDVRILAATNQPLQMKVKQGLFREDLFYRLNVVTIGLPPLRERRDDIPLLADYFLKKYSAEMNKQILGFDPRTVDRLLQYSWPGNIRELEHAIEQTVVLTPNTVILPEDLPDTIRKDSAFTDQFPPHTLMRLDELEKRYMIWVLEQTKNNKSEAARVLGIDRRTLYRMAKRYDIKIDEENVI